MQPENNRRTTRVGDVTKKRSSKPSLIMVPIKYRFLFISYRARIKIGRNLSGDPGMDAGPQHGHTRRAEGCNWGKLQKCPPDRAVITGAVPRSRARYCCWAIGKCKFCQWPFFINNSTCRRPRSHERTLKIGI